jgi:hypothetical protein
VMINRIINRDGVSLFFDGVKAASPGKRVAEILPYYICLCNWTRIEQQMI